MGNPFGSTYCFVEPGHITPRFQEPGNSLPADDEHWRCVDVPATIGLRVHRCHFKREPVHDGKRRRSTPWNPPSALPIYHECDDFSVHSIPANPHFPFLYGFSMEASSSHQHKRSGLCMATVSDDESQGLIREAISLVIAASREATLQPACSQSAPPQRAGNSQEGILEEKQSKHDSISNTITP